MPLIFAKQNPAIFFLIVVILLCLGKKNIMADLYKIWSHACDLVNVFIS